MKVVMETAGKIKMTLRQLALSDQNSLQDRKENAENKNITKATQIWLNVW